MKCSYCQKDCKNHNSWRNHERLCKLNPNKQIAVNNWDHKKQKCRFCNRILYKNNVQRHEIACRSNPAVVKSKSKICSSCGKIYFGNGLTCSYSCANRITKTGPNNGNWKETRYRTTCFHYHGKRCIVCGENKIVEVHHYNHDHADNRKENLIPLCPTHHQYIHSRYKDEVLPIIEKFILRMV